MDADTDNTYMVTVKASYGSGAEMVMDTQAVTVYVTDVEEKGTVTLSSMTPVVDTPLTATLTDPDTVMEDSVMWQWSKSMTMNGTFVAIGEATMMSYTPTAADEDYYLRATATYTDGFDTGNTAMAVSASAVSTDAPDERPAIVQRYDTDGTVGISIAELFVAIDDYFEDEINIAQLFAVIDAYFDQTE